MTITGTYPLIRRTCMNTFASAHIPPHRHGYISMLLLSTSPYCSTAPQNRAALRRDYDRSTWEDLGTRSNMSSLAAQGHSKATEHYVARRLGAASQTEHASKN